MRPDPSEPALRRRSRRRQWTLNRRMPASGSFSCGEWGLPTHQRRPAPTFAAAERPLTPVDLEATRREIEQSDAPQAKVQLLNGHAVGGSAHSQSILTRRAAWSRSLIDSHSVRSIGSRASRRTRCRAIAASSRERQGFDRQGGQLVTLHGQVRRRAPSSESELSSARSKDLVKTSRLGEPRSSKIVDAVNGEIQTSTQTHGEQESMLSWCVGGRQKGPTRCQAGANLTRAIDY